MRKKDVQIGGRYKAKVSGKHVVVRILGPAPFGGWFAVNEATGRRVHIRTVGRLAPLKAFPGRTGRGPIRDASLTDTLGLGAVDL